MKRILSLSLIFILLNTVTASGRVVDDIREPRQNTKLNKRELLELEIILNQDILQNDNINTLGEKQKEFTISRGDNKDYIPILAIVTAYAPYDNKSGICNDGTPDTTATGTKPKMGTLASDPKRIPYGTEIYIEGYGFGVVEDTGSALRKDKENIRIDVFMETYEEAIEWGKKEMIIYIIK